MGRVSTLDDDRCDAVGQLHPAQRPCERLLRRMIMEQLSNTVRNPIVPNDSPCVGVSIRRVVGGRDGHVESENAGRTFGDGYRDYSGE